MILKVRKMLQQLRYSNSKAQAVVRFRTSFSYLFHKTKLVQISLWAIKLNKYQVLFWTFYPFFYFNNFLIHIRLQHVIFFLNFSGAKVVKTAHSLTPETQRRKSESASQGPQRAFKCPQKGSPVQTATSAAWQSTSGLSCRAQQAPYHNTGPGEKSLPQAQHRTVFG